MDVVKDLLDKPVVDRNGREMGRVDGIVLDQRAGQPPRLAALLIGPSVLGWRLHPTIGRWVEALQHAFRVDEGQPVRIDFADVAEIGDSVKVDRSIGETAAGVVEHRLRRWVTKIPGSR